MNFDLSKILPDWNVVRQLGEGSFGKVYEIIRRDEVFGIEDISALKVVSIPASAGDWSAMLKEYMNEATAHAELKNIVGDYIREIKIMQRLKGCANIVGYEDYQVVENENGVGWTIFIRMEMLTELPEYMMNNRMTVSDVIKMGIDICSALEVCAKESIVHRDIKPDNIFVSRDGRYKLGDFGVAKALEKTNSALSQKGTYTYMAPEVCRQQKYTACVDVYSLGIVMYKLLNQYREPFVAVSAAPPTQNEKNEALTRRMNGEPVPPLANVPAELSEIVLKACAYEPAERYDHPTKMRQALVSVFNKYTSIAGSPLTKPIILPTGEESGSRSMKSVSHSINYGLAETAPQAASKTTMTDAASSAVNQATDLDATVSIFGKDIPQANEPDADEIRRQRENETAEADRRNEELRRREDEQKRRAEEEKRRELIRAAREREKAYEERVYNSQSSTPSRSTSQAYNSQSNTVKSIPAELVDELETLKKKCMKAKNVSAALYWVSFVFIFVVGILVLVFASGDINIKLPMIMVVAAVVLCMGMALATTTHKAYSEDALRVATNLYVFGGILIVVGNILCIIAYFNMASWLNNQARLKKLIEPYGLTLSNI